MKSITGKISNIVMGEQAGTVTIKELDKDKKLISVVQVQYPDNKEVAKFTHGDTVTVSFTSKK